MEEKIMDVLRRMQMILNEEQLRELKEVLQMTFTGCRVIQETDLQVVDRSWEVDLEEFLMSKALEGKASKTVKQYRYELVRLLTYINKPVKNIDSGASLNVNGKSTALLETKYNPYQLISMLVFHVYLRHTTASPLEYFM